MKTGAFQPFASIHVDLDGAAEIYEIHGWRHDSKQDWLFESGMKHMLELFAAHGLQATLFVIARQLEDGRKRTFLEEAARRGHEIASHTLTHRKLTGLPTAEKRQEIFTSRRRIEDTLSVPVLGFRAPAFDFDRESLEFVDAAGYRYDSSTFSSGKAGHHNPHRPLFGRPLLELPLPAHAPLPFPFHPCYSLVLGDWYFKSGLRRFRSTHAPAVLLFHLTDFADPLPQDHLPHRRAAFYTLSHLPGDRKRRRCGAMIALLRQHYNLVTTTQLLSENAA